MEYRIVEGKENIKVEDVVRLLKMTYWADSRPVEKIDKSMENSKCVGLYVDGVERLVGFARVISDYATTYYLCDVIIDEDYQHKGLGKALVSYVVSMPDYKGLRGLLVTKDAHKLYEKYGYEIINDRAMMRSPES
ncbi:GNAT family N-acetyltransferase [Pseudobutyrivibrio sp.]|jgi:ribosomal protein S18 acetylase RimI-like enzyme|uniref:GNAT family N-acetyltransferase n=1 Tax=Pseudobutyrivibrio sp. TaxID=2014367 RepID=UPI0025FBBFD3|nr:GNAT family N-acetyltransferase [Pseudobutyrivibrio sp.]